MAGDFGSLTSRRPLLAAVAIVLGLAALGTGSKKPVPEISSEELTRRREEMVARHLAPHIEDERVLAAMRAVPRHLFVPADLRDSAYANHPLPIGHGQTISQPYVVAIMTALLSPTDESRILEIGTGSGYQAAVLAEVAGEVYSIEIVEPLAERAARDLAAAGYDRIHLRTGDGYQGWPENAPFDGIIVTCAPDHVPQPLQDQLAEGGRLVIPVGERGVQELVVIEKKNGQLVREDVLPVRFVPMTGEAQGLKVEK